MSGLLLWLILAAGGGSQGPSAPSPVGVYRLREGPDVASELAVKADGSFDYVLAAGALDEAADGHWRRLGTQIRLTTEPKPVPPTFAAGTARRNGAQALIVHVTSPDGYGIAGVDFRIEFDTGPSLADYTHSDEGWTLDRSEHRRPVAIILAFPIYGLVSPRFAIDAAKANELSFVLTPHDMGRVDFVDLPLDIFPGKLVMHRDGALLEYVRESR